MSAAAVTSAIGEFGSFLDRIGDSILNQLPAQVVVTYIFLSFDPFDRKEGNQLTWGVNAALFILGVYIIQRVHERITHVSKLKQLHGLDEQ